MYSAAGSMLEIAAGHWPFSDQFQYMANQNQLLLPKFIVHFNERGINNLQKSSSSKNGQPISDPYVCLPLQAGTHIP